MERVRLFNDHFHAAAELSCIHSEPRMCEKCEEYVSNGDQLVNEIHGQYRSPQSADVETVRNKIELSIKFGLPIDARMALKEALENLDRIDGMLRGTV